MKNIQVQEKMKIRFLDGNEWNNDNHDYGCFFKAEGLYHDFGMLTKKKKKEFIDSCIEAGINKGSIKKNRNHTYTLMSLRS